MNRISLALGIALTAGTALGQSFNIDFDASGSGVGAPVNTFGGAAGQPGFWNVISANSNLNVNLSGLNGQVSGVTLNRATNGTFGNSNSANTTGSYERLLDDYQSVSADTMVFTFNNLQPGKYMIYTYAGDPGSGSNLATVQVPQVWEYCQSAQYTGGPMPVNGFRAGATHAVHTKIISAGQALTVNVAGSLGTGIISGMQIVRVSDEALAKVTLFVNDNAAGNNNGSSWADAFTDLQNALATARLGGGPSFQVWTATGMYKPTAGADRTATFSIPSGLEVYGGFAGTEATLAERTNPQFNLTYLSGAIGAAGNADNSHTVVTLDNTNSNTVIDGFYIVSGNNTASGRGGGMLMDYANSAEIRNCSFSGNSANIGGGAISAYRSGFRAINCTFYNNDVPNGQGGAIESYGPIPVTTRLVNCRFLGNSSIGGGGAVSLGFTYGEMANCFFSGNTGGSGDGGAIRIAGDTQYLKLWNCTLSKNSTGSDGGGIYASTGSDVTLYNSILWGNTAGFGTTVQQQVATVTAHGSILTESYNTIQGQDADPRFVDADGADNVAGNFDDNCRLLQASPCIDAGSNALIPVDFGDVDEDGIYWEENLSLDFDMQARQVEILSVPNTGSGTSPVVDRGAWEFRETQWCYANCDNSAIAPVLNVNDFVCFQTKFASGDPYANCDGSTIQPVLNVNDFICFQTKFAQGCP